MENKFMKSRVIDLFTSEDMKGIANMYIASLTSYDPDDTDEEILDRIEHLKQIRDVLKDCPEAKYYYDHCITGIEILENELENSKL